MIKHVVMWTLKDKSRADYLKKEIESMKGKISTMVDVEAGVNYNSSDAAFDLILISVHNSKEDLDAYQSDPIHCALRDELVPEVLTRHVVDFEFQD